MEPRAPLDRDNVPARRLRWSGFCSELAVAWVMAVVGAAACGAAADRLGVDEHEAGSVDTDDGARAAGDAPASDVGATSGSPLPARTPIAWSSLPPFGAYPSDFPFPEDAAPAEQRRWLLAKAETVLSARCGQCHGSRAESFAVDGDFGDVNDFDSIIRQGQLILCDARRSPVILRMLDGSMPPPADGSIEVNDIAIVRDATDFDCPAE